MNCKNILVIVIVFISISNLSQADDVVNKLCMSHNDASNRIECFHDFDLPYYQFFYRPYYQFNAKPFIVSEYQELRETINSMPEKSQFDTDIEHKKIIKSYYQNHIKPKINKVVEVSDFSVKKAYSIENQTLTLNLFREHKGDLFFSEISLEHVLKGSYKRFVFLIKHDFRNEFTFPLNKDIAKKTSKNLIVKYVFTLDGLEWMENINLPFKPYEYYWKDSGTEDGIFVNLHEIIIEIDGRTKYILTKNKVITIK